MKITKVQIHLFEGAPTGRLLAFAKVVFDDCFLIRGIKIIEGNRRFIAMPTRKKNNGEDIDLAFPITKEFREYLESEILSAYEEALGCM